MIVTPFAAIAFLLGLILLFRGSVTGMFCLFIAATLFGVRRRSSWLPWAEARSRRRSSF